jgi:hypothetical protein
VIQKDIQDNVESHIKLMITQIESYLPFIKVAFPYSKNMADACFSLIVGNALSVFINQYAMRLKYPSASDFEDFGKLTLKYRNQVDEFFK